MVISCRIWLTSFLAVPYMSLFVARYLDILLPTLISGHKTLVRDLTIACYVELLYVFITRKGSGSTNMSAARESAEKFPGGEGNRKIAKKTKK